MGFSKRHIYLETQHFQFSQLRENDKRTHPRFIHCKSVSHWFPKWYWTGKELLMSKIASSTKFWFLYLQRYRSSWVRPALPFSSVKNCCCWTFCFCLAIVCRADMQNPLRYALEKKLRYYLGIFPKRRTPPPSPLLGTPYSKKKFFVYFAF